ncbi:MAG: hypothetical protein QF464_19940, partial [Myxococcota bacterium]|nr:hypothetical protein [Myxococcota bacterium]
MVTRLKDALVDRSLTRYPVPIADAVAGLACADSLHEQRDRVVEVFRAVLRTLAGAVLAARVQFGPGPGETSAEVQTLLRQLRRRGLTDGQWVGLVRELLRPWKDDPESHPLPQLVTAFFGRKAPLPPLLDSLLAMRKSETVAHGAAGDEDDLAQVLAARVPALEALLETVEPLWEALRLVVPLSQPVDASERQRAWDLTGVTTARGRWRRMDLGPGVRVAPGAAVLADCEGAPMVALSPIVIVRRPSPDQTEECFVLDGGDRKGARYVAIPSMAEHRDADAWASLEEA